uniref:Uncharacterized protein n=1 Tax=Oryza meridionalis TaxID=40149 RepID=A0A0E0EJZ5_9ORYZ
MVVMLVGRLYDEPPSPKHLKPWPERLIDRKSVQTMMAESTDKNQLVSGECIDVTSSKLSVESILCNPECKRKAAVLNQQFKDADFTISKF